MDQTMKRLQQFFDEHDDLRVFAMNGSRVNPQIPDDRFKDYDVVFFTGQIEKYRKQPEWLNYFGELLLVTEPDAAGYFGSLTFPEQDGYIYLAQYTNGVRIDLQFLDLARLPAYLSADSLTKIIGDKDARITQTIVPSDRDYWQKKPTEAEICYAVKEFWWQFNNTLKATLRDEFLLAQFYLNLTRNELLRLVTWTVAFEQGFDRSYGKENQQVLSFLSSEQRQQIKKTFATTSEAEIVAVLKSLGVLERQFLAKISEQTAYELAALSELQKVPAAFLRSKNEAALAAEFIFD